MQQSLLIEIALPLSLFVIMVGMGMTLTPRDFREVVIAPRATLFGTFAQILILPLVAFALAVGLDLSPALAVGLIVIAACPGGTTSNLFVFIGRGDVALSIVLTVIASLITIFTLPVFTGWALEWFMGEDESFSLPMLRTFLTLFLIVLVPVIIGMTIRRYAESFAVRSERVVGLFGLFVLVGVIIAILVQVGDQAEVLFYQAGLAVALLNIAGLVIGIAGGRLARLPREQGFSVAIELGIKNGTLGLMVTLTLLDSPEISVPAAVYGMMMFVFGFLMLGYARYTGVGSQPAGQPGGEARSPDL